MAQEDAFCGMLVGEREGWMRGLREKISDKSEQRPPHAGAFGIVAPNTVASQRQIRTTGTGRLREIELGIRRHQKL
jgi:hypothetical protein